MRRRRGERRRGGFRGRGEGGGTKPGSGPGGYCVCPNCGHKLEHQVGKRCLDTQCPECGTAMARE
jgi:hypothetical protein